MPSWTGSLKIVILILFLLEIYIAIRIFRKRRRQSQIGAHNNQSVIIIFNQIPPPNNPTIRGTKDAIHPYQTTQLVLPNPNNKTQSRISHSLFLGGLFLVVFIIINFLLRPFTNAWSLILLAILLPFPFLVIPSLFNLKSFGTFSSLIFGLGLGAFSLLLML